MSSKQFRAFKIASDYLESKRITQDSSPLEDRISYWDNKYPNISDLQLAALALVNPSANFCLSNSDIREISNIFFHSPNYLNS